MHLSVDVFYFLLSATMSATTMPSWRFVRSQRRRQNGNMKVWRTDGRMDGWTDGRMDGWKDGRTVLETFLCLKRKKKSKSKLNLIATLSNNFQMGKWKLFWVIFEIQDFHPQLLSYFIFICVMILCCDPWVWISAPSFGNSWHSKAVHALSKISHPDGGRNGI